MNYTDLGNISYLDAVSIQEKEKLAVLEGKSAGTIFLLEHFPVITLGRNAKESNIILPETFIKNNGFEICHTSRGGDVTIHEPGQLVIYFVLPLKGKSVKTFVMDIMDRTKQLLFDLYSIEANYLKDTPGLWVEDRKICSFGFDLRSRVSMHGLALNVSNSLLGFKLINPCGLAGAKITSVELETKTEHFTKKLKNHIHNSKIFN